MSMKKYLAQIRCHEQRHPSQTSVFKNYFISNCDAYVVRMKSCEVCREVLCGGVRGTEWFCRWRRRVLRDRGRTRGSVVCPKMTVFILARGELGAGSGAAARVAERAGVAASGLGLGLFVIGKQVLSWHSTVVLKSSRSLLAI